MEELEQRANKLEKEVLERNRAEKMLAFLRLSSITRYLCIIMMAICMLPCWPSFLYANDSQPKNVLVLHSYHRGLSWDEAIDRGIESILRKDNHKIEIQTEYMDTKRIYDPMYIRQLYEIYRHKFRNRRFDSLICSDNNALDFLLKYRDEIFSETPVVFCGINNFKDSMLEDKTLYTGAVEDVDIRETLNIALKLHPETRHIFVYGSYTTTYFANKAILEKIIPDYKNSVEFSFIENLHIRQVQNSIRKLPNNSLILIISSMRDEQGRLIPFQRFPEMMASVSSVPIYGCWDFLLGHGIVGGKLISGFSQGQTAIQMALRILNGEKTENISIIKESPNRFMFDYIQMQDFGISLSQLPKGSIVINKPYSFYSEHKGYIWSGVAIVTIFSLIVLVLATNIINRKRAEMALRESEESYRMLAEECPISIMSFDREEKITFVNKWHLKTFARLKYGPEFFLGKKITELPGLVRAGVAPELKRILRGESLMLEEVYFPEFTGGHSGYQSIKAVPVYKEGELDGGILIRHDVTERKRAEEALKESESRYRTLVESSTDAILMMDKERNIASCNQAFLNLFGYRKEEIEGKSIRIIHPSDQSFDSFGDTAYPIIERDGYFRTEWEFTRKDGAVFPVETVTSLIRNSDGTMEGYIAMIRDFTERKQAEEDRTRLVTAIEQAAESVVISHRDGTIQYVNPAFEAITGYSREEAIGQNPRILKSEKNGKEFYTAMWDTLTNGMVWRGHFINKKRDGTLYEEEATISPIKNASGEIINFVAVKRDVTEEIKLEGKIRQAQKMEAIGTLAGGIAHDFNNILSAIIGYAELAEYDMPEGSEIRGNLREVLKAGSRARDLVKQILAFSRQGEQERKPVQISLIVKESLKLLRASLPASIDIRKNILSKPGLDTVLADPTQIHQILMNLCTNAAHAMREKVGLLEVEIRNVEVGNQEIGFPNAKSGKIENELAPGSYVRLAVSDTGCGMTADVMKRIFEPYFTTKEKGEGTGLGLATVHGIVKKYGGTVTVYSEPGKGSTFHVYFPAVQREEISEKLTEESIPTGNEHILFVDDEEPLVQLGRQMLTRLGYEVVTRTSSVEALQLFRVKPSDFDLIITDMTMPNMEGDMLVGELLQIRPDIPIILSTGFSEKVTEERAKEMGIRAVTMKPLVMRELAETIRRVLEE